MNALLFKNTAYLSSSKLTCIKITFKDWFGIVDYRESNVYFLLR